MSAGSAASNGGGAGGNTGPDAGFFITEQKKKQKINEEGYGPDYQGDIYNFKKPPKKKNILENIVDNSIITNNPLSDHTEEVNRKFFEEKVKPAGKSKYNTYEDYIRARGRGEVDAYGREISQSDNGGNNQPAQETIIKKNIGGTEVQTTQEKLDEEKAKDDEYDVRKVKKKGRKQYTLTSSKGVTQVSDDYSLGKKSLLGTV